MRKWNLREHGDGAERKWWPKIGSNFPSYEVFWREHFVPLTCRVLNPSNIRLRLSVPRHLSQLATSHYATFLHLARSQSFLATFTSPAGPRFIYEFYSHLCSVRDTTNKFHHATNKILDRYDKTYIPELKTRLSRFGDSDLGREYDNTFDIIEQYRNHLIHDCGTIMFDGKVPKVDKLGVYDDLVELSHLLAAKNRDQILNEDFVDAHIQSTADLERLENLLDGIWVVILREFEEMEHLEKYRADQALVTDEDIAFCTSMRFRISSDTPGFSGSEGPISGSASFWSEEL